MVLGLGDDQPHTSDFFDSSPQAILYNTTVHSLPMLFVQYCSG